jgi:hypothetical protein
LHRVCPAFRRATGPSLLTTSCHPLFASRPNSKASLCSITSAVVKVHPSSGKPKVKSGNSPAPSITFFFPLFSFLFPEPASAGFLNANRQPLRSAADDSLPVFHLYLALSSPPLRLEIIPGLYPRNV